MKPEHHLDDATLISYSAGALAEALSVAAGAHLAMCAHCRARLRRADAVGGALLDARLDAGGRVGEPASSGDAVSPDGAAARADMLRRLDASGPDVDIGKPLGQASNRAASLPGPTVCAGSDDGPRPAAGGVAAGEPSAVDSTDVVPLTLRPYFGETYSGLRWRFLAPGVRIAKAEVSQGRLFLLKLSPGVRMPEHGHGSSELSLVLRGAYTDRFGVFRVGDIADLDSDVEHQPTVTDDDICITLGATDAPIRFKSWGLRLLQPWFGM